MDCDTAISLPGAHDLPDSFPSFPLLVRLLGFAHRFPPTRHAIRDLCTGSSASHIQLLNDALSLRNSIYRALDLEARNTLASEEEVPFLLLAGPGYQYVVGFLAILSLGGIVVPISPHVPLKEALYFAEKSTANGVVFDSRYPGVVSSLKEHACQSRSPVLPAIEIGTSLGLKTLRPNEIYIQTGRSLDSDKPGLMIFTSGTTGKPKAVVLPREILVSGVQTLTDHFNITPDDITLHCMPVHHIAGIAVCFVPFLFGGACIEFDSFDVRRVWKRWRQGGITVFGGVPTMYSRLMRHFEDNIQTALDRDAYVTGVRSLRFMMSGTSALPAPLRKKWWDLSGGKRILERYGASEFGASLLTPLDPDIGVPHGSVGQTLAGCEVKLASEPEGEILVRVPGMFLRYHQDPEATLSAFDVDGFYKTGDIGRREGPFWFILGRESVDIIKSGGYKISALDIEREILGLGYVAEAAVVGTADEEFGQRVAAAVALRHPGTLSISKLRDDLRGSLSAYKLPTLLYVTDELPKTVSGKVQKAVLREDVFQNSSQGRFIQRFVPRSAGVGTLHAKL